LETPHHWIEPGNFFSFLHATKAKYTSTGTDPKLDAMAERLSKADCFVLITPEYNHAPAPALLNFMDHFGANRFAFKPSAICAYSGLFLVY